MNTLQQNQVNPPRKQTRWGNNSGWKIYFKKDGSSMLLFKNLSHSNAFVRCNTLKRIYSDWNGRFIVTR